MQLDMHYYGTWCMARAAGMTPEAATIAATAAQFVDDNAHGHDINLPDGSRIGTLPTAHHCDDGNNLLREDQWHVWVPFHFLPGNEGDDCEQKLQCRAGSQLMRDVIAHHMKQAKKRYGLELMGVTAHVLMDTYSHYGFSGLSSDDNKIVSSSIRLENVEPHLNGYLAEKAEEFTGMTRQIMTWGRGVKTLSSRKNRKWWSVIKTSVTSLVAETLSDGLGHGPALTYPDRPFLKWSFEYKSKANLQMRDNPATFMEGCKALHKLFTDFLAKNPKYADQHTSPVPFKNMKPVLKEIIGFQGNKEDRCEQWCRMAKSGVLFDRPDFIPPYNAEIWKNDLKSLSDLSPANAAKQPVARFFEAAGVHRDYVLWKLMPECGLGNTCKLQ